MASDWRELSFPEAVEINPRVKLKKGKIYPFVDMKAVSPEWRSVTESEKRVFVSGGSKFEPFDTLLARITPCLENGKIARYIASSGTGGPAFGSTEFIVIRGKDGVTDNDFAYYLTKWLEFRQFAIAQMTGTSGRQRVPVESLGGFKAPVPPLPEQRAIAHILGSLDDKIELNRRMNETLEAMAQALFKSWFVDFDPVIDNALAAGNPIPEELQERAARREALGDGRKPLPEDIRSLFPSEFELTEEMGWVPKGWKVCRIKEEFNLTMGQSPPGSTYNKEGSGMVFFQGRTDFGFRYPSGRVFCTQPKRLAKKDDTLVSVRAPVGDINLAKEDCCIGRGIAAVRHKSGSRSYTYYSMRELKKHFDCFDDTGTVFGSINQEDFKSIYWLRKPNGLVKYFEEVSGCLDQKIETCTNNIDVLVGLRDTLLPKLISGEIRIPDAEKLAESAA